MYAQTNRSLHHNGWSTSSQTDLKADQLSSKASRGFHCKLMRCLLQCPCLSTDRALINQGNHKEIWERLCSKSPWDHKCTASKSVRPHYPSSLRFVLFVFLLLFFFLLFFFLPPSTSLHRLPCRHRFHRHFKIARVLICTVTLNVHRFFFFWMIVPNWNGTNGTRRQLNHSQNEEESALLLWPSTATCWICHFTMTP